MSLIPFILDLAEELNDFNRSLVSSMEVDDFGFGMYPQELHHARRPRTVSQLYLLPNAKVRLHPYYRSGAAGSVGSNKNCCNKAATAAMQLPTQTEDRERESVNDKDSSAAVKPSAATAAYSVVNKHGFQVSMNVKQFSPNELTVKTIDNCIVVEGQHEEKEDGHGVISRHFVRKYMLPKGYDPKEVLSTLSSDGILTVRAPPPTKPDEELHERVVHIQHTGPAQLAAKESREKASATVAAATQQPTTTTQTAAAAPTVDQQQQQPQEPIEETSKPQPQESNGDANANEILAEQETEKEPVSAEPLLADSIVAPAAMDVTVSAVVVDAEVTTAAAAAEPNDTDIADVPMTVSIAAEANDDGAMDSALLVVADDVATEAAVADIATAVEAATAEDVVMPVPPTAGDLVAAADAAIILAKTQCGNGSNNVAVTTAAEEIAN